MNPSLTIKYIKMEQDEIKQRVKKVTARVLEIDESEISDNANFSFDLGRIFNAKYHVGSCLSGGIQH